jgi:hypothetical protein
MAGFGHWDSGSSPDFYDQIRAAAVASFRETQLGQDFEAEYLKQSVVTAVDDPFLWLGVGLIAAVLIYVLIK